MHRNIEQSWPNLPKYRLVLKGDKGAVVIVTITLNVQVVLTRMPN